MSVLKVFVYRSQSKGQIQLLQPKKVWGFPKQSRWAMIRTLLLPFPGAADTRPPPDAATRNLPTPSSTPSSPPTITNLSGTGRERPSDRHEDEQASVGAPHSLLSSTTRRTPCFQLHCTAWVCSSYRQLNCYHLQLLSCFLPTSPCTCILSTGYITR